MGKRKGFLWLNILLTAALMAVLPWLLSRFDLPASLMPAESILDISHYTQTFSRILSSLDSLGDRTVHEALGQATAASAVVLGIGVLVTAALIALENRICRPQKQSKQS